MAVVVACICASSGLSALVTRPIWAVPLRASAISAARGATVLDPLRLSFYSLAALQPATAPIKTMPDTPMGSGRERCRPETCSSMKCSGPACG